MTFVRKSKKETKWQPQKHKVEKSIWKQRDVTIFWANVIADPTALHSPSPAPRTAKQFCKTVKGPVNCLPVAVTMVETRTYFPKPAGMSPASDHVHLHFTTFPLEQHC